MCFWHGVCTAFITLWGETNEKSRLRGVWFMHSQLALARRVVMALIVIGLWQVLATDQVHAGLNQWTSNGPEGGDVRALAIDPQTPTTLYAGTLNGVFKSTDGGASWTAR